MGVIEYPECTCIAMDAAGISHSAYASLQQVIHCHLRGLMPSVLMSGSMQAVEVIR